MFIKSTFFAFLLSVAVSSCNQTTDTPPKLFLAQDKMKLILTEVHLMDAIAEQKASGNKQVEKNLAEKGFIQILANHSITKAQFDSNHLYYQRHPKILDKIYTQMLSEMSQQQAELSK